MDTELVLYLLVLLLIGQRANQFNPVFYCIIFGVKNFRLMSQIFNNKILK